MLTMLRECGSHGKTRAVPGGATIDLIPEPRVALNRWNETNLLPRRPALQVRCRACRLTGFQSVALHAVLV